MELTPKWTIEALSARGFPQQYLYFETAEQYPGRGTDPLWNRPNTLPKIRVDCRYLGTYEQVAQHVVDRVRTFFTETERVWCSGKPKRWGLEVVGFDGQDPRFHILTDPADVEPGAEWQSGMFHENALAQRPAEIQKMWQAIRDKLLSSKDLGGASRYPSSLTTDIEDLPDVFGDYDGWKARMEANPKYTTFLVDGRRTAPQVIADCEAAYAAYYGAAPVNIPLEWGQGRYSPAMGKSLCLAEAAAISGMYAIRKCVYEPFQRVFGPIPCGNWNTPHGGTKNYPVLIGPNGHVRPFGADPAYMPTGISINSMYGGPLGDWRPNQPELHAMNPRFGTGPGWKQYLNLKGEDNARIGHKAIGPAGAEWVRQTLKAWPNAQAWPSIDLTCKDPTQRPLYYSDLGNALEQMRKAGSTGVWCFDPGYSTDQWTRDQWIQIVDANLRAGVPARPRKRGFISSLFERIRS